MINFFNNLNLSVGQGAVIVVCISVLLVPLWASTPNAVLRFSLAVIVPILVSYGFYWFPNFSHAQDYEYRNWSFLFISCWAVPASIASILATVLFRRSKRKKN